MLSLYLPALLVALVITMVEMTEVVAVVFALAPASGSVGHGAAGAVAGTTVVGVIAFVSGAALLALPRADLLWGASLTLFAFGIFLFRSTLRAFRRDRARSAGAPSPSPGTYRALQFAGGFSVGAVEATEAVIVLLALAAAGYGFSAIVGALVGGAALAAIAFAVHQEIRRIKVLTLRWGATSLLFTFAVFWSGEAAGLAWPLGDAFLVVLFLIALLIVRGAVESGLRLDIRVKANG